MSNKFRNVNEVWAYVLTQTLKSLGLKFVAICPGSRSTPLAVAFAQSDIEAISILDERCAAFFALGKAKATGQATAVVCTSGTAAANFYPAVIEAKESGVPLLLLTADRPPQLRDCRSGQTIDQLKLYGNYPNWQIELALPSVEIEMLAYLRQIVIHAWERSHFPFNGPVHLNIPFSDPLAPVPDFTDVSHLYSLLDNFFTGITDILPITSSRLPLPQEWLQNQKGIIIAGVAQPQQPQIYCRAIAHLSQILQFPVLAEGLSPVRNYAYFNPHLISTYDLILRSSELANQLTPEIVIQIGALPTSPVLRHWLKTTQARRWVINKTNQNLDPLHGKTTHLKMSVEEWELGEIKTKEGLSSYLQLWREAEIRVRTAVDETLGAIEELFEGKAAWLLSKTLPQQTPLFIANSMSVRHVEFFWKPNNSRVQPYFNRGANGIDGTLSTALGIAHHQSSVMLTGDLALLHDTNGFLLRNKFCGHLTIVLINNNGGGIFETLPIANFEPPFEEFFATPQNIDFVQLCATYGVEYELITSWAQLQAKLNPLPTTGIRVLELQTNRKTDSYWLKENLGTFIQ